MRFAACDCRGGQVSEKRGFCANVLHVFPPFPLQVGPFQGHSGALVADLAVISQGSCYIHQLHSTAITMFIACLLHLLRATPCYAARDSFGLSHCSFSFDFFSCISLNSCKALGVSPEAQFSISSSECLNDLIQPMAVSLCLYTLRIQTLLSATLAHPLPHTPDLC